MNFRFALGFALSLASGCGLDRKPQRALVHVVFDPDTHNVPMPTDVLRDPVAQRLQLPATDANLTDAEREFFDYLNGLDGWSSTMQFVATFDGPVDPASINFDTVQVWDF